MNISAWSIRRPLPAILFFACLCIGGVVSFRLLGVTDMPEFEVPVVSIDATLPGASPSQLESEVTGKLENSVASLGSVKSLVSTISGDTSSTTVEFELGQDPRDALERVRAAVGRTRAQLPAALETPVVAPVTLPNTLLTYAVSSPGMDARDLSWWVDNQLTKTLSAVPGVGRVERVGGVEREIHIDLDAVHLRALKITATQVSQQLRAMLARDPAGKLRSVDGGEQPVLLADRATSLTQIAALLLPLGDGHTVALGELGKVSDTSAPQRQIALLNGHEVIAVRVYRAPGRDEVSTAAGVRAAMAAASHANPQVRIALLNDHARPIKQVLDNVMRALYEGCLLAVLVVWLFLRDWRATAVAALALPLSILPTFLAMSLLGFTLNQLTLLALVLVIGVLVDDAIVEVENITRHLQTGKSPREAAIDAAGEIGIAVIATSLTLVAVFLPTAFMGGYIGKYFREFGWTVALAVLASLLVARLLTPMLAAQMLRRAPRHSTRRAQPAQGTQQALLRRYLRGVEVCLARPRVTLLAGAAFCCGSMVLLGALPKSFIPSDDRSRIVLDMTTAPGSGLDTARNAAEAARRTASGVPEITSSYATIGTGAAGAGSAGGEPHAATLSFVLQPLAERQRSQAQIEADLRRRLVAIPGARFSSAAEESGKTASLVLSSDDPALLERTAREVEQQMRGLRNLGSVSSSASALRPELIVKPDEARAAALGVTDQALEEALRMSLEGDYLANLPSLHLPARQIPIRVQVAQPGGSSGDWPGLFGQLLVPGRNGNVPLANVADLTSGSEPARIDRQDRRRSVTLNAEIGNQPLGDVVAAIDRLPAVRHLPAGVERAASGDARSLADLFGSFAYAMAFGILSIYVMLVLLFGGFMVPVTILVALPLSLGGAAAALLCMSLDLSLASLIGILMLMGISTKNSILLVEYVVAARRAGQLSRADAIRDACRKRARPIVMTTFAMLAGMLPLALESRGDGFRTAMAVTVAGGLITSTLLSLFLVPAAYVAFDDLQHWLRRRFAAVARTRLPLAPGAARKTRRTHLESR
ncbi:efflux RND transporter permease subunit [Paraburkholderia jirisanensis]